jgi:uncharacterized protein involved in copper resistance
LYQFLSLLRPISLQGSVLTVREAVKLQNVSEMRIDHAKTSNMKHQKPQKELANATNTSSPPIAVMEAANPRTTASGADSEKF